MMRPALSVIFFTVASGAGLGLLILLAVLQSTGYAGGLSARMFAWGLAIAAALITAGLCASVFHLANPKNAWRALSQWRQSWLSREAVLAIALYPTSIAYVWAIYAQTSPRLQWVLAAAVVFVAIGVLVSTGMIYACLKTIPQWATRLVPAAYVTLGLYCGSLILVALVAADASALVPFAAVVYVLLMLAAIVKGVYYRRFKAADACVSERSLTQALGAATGLPNAPVRLLDVGHSHGTFLTEEFGFQLARSRASFLRYAFLGASFVAPILVLGFEVRSPVWLALTAAVAFAGVLIERWLFFAEARHVVRAFHGG